MLQSSKKKITKEEPLKKPSSFVTNNEDESESDVSSETEDEEEGEEEASESTNHPIRNELQNELNKMSFEEIQKLQNKIGLKKFKDVVNSEKINAERSKSFKRLNKNRPREASSKRPVTPYRQVFANAEKHKRKIIDPRFETAFGEYEPGFFRKNYSFVNDIRKNEKDTLQKQLKQEDDSERKKQIKSQLERLKNQIQAYSENEKKQELKTKLKEETLKDVKEGKKPHYVNKTEMKLLELAEKYKELKKSGKVDKFLAKKRKKQLSKASKRFKAEKYKELKKSGKIDKFLAKKRKKQLSKASKRFTGGEDYCEKKMEDLDIYSDGQ